MDSSLSRLALFLDPRFKAAANADLRVVFEAVSRLCVMCMWSASAVH